MDKLRLAIDMDDTICLLMKAVYEDHKNKYPDFPLEYSEIESYKQHMYHPDYNEREFFKQEGVFLNLEVIDEYMVEVMERLNEKYELIIVTSAFPENVLEKWQWLQKHLPFIPYENFIVAKKKYLIDCDILIDDAYHNLEEWNKLLKVSFGFLHHWNHNIKELDKCIPVSSWKEIEEQLKLNFENPVDTLIRG